MSGANHPMGPLALADFIGLDIVLHMSSLLQGEYKESRFAPPRILRRMVLAGILGRKSGKGFFDYSTNPPDAESGTAGALVPSARLDRERPAFARRAPRRHDLVDEPAMYRMGAVCRGILQAGEAHVDAEVPRLGGVGSAGSPTVIETTPGSPRSVASA